MGKDNFVMGMDFGTDSVRTIVADAANGREIAASVFHYPRWRDGLYCDPAASRFRQHPLDYIEGIEATVKDCVKQAGSDRIRALSVDTTGSTPVAVDVSGTPLGLIPGFEEKSQTPVCVVEGPHGYPRSRGDQCFKPALSSKLFTIRRRYLFLGMVLGQVTARASRGPRGTKSLLFLGGTLRLGALPAHGWKRCPPHEAERLRGGA